MVTEPETNALLRIVSTLGRHRLDIESLTSTVAGGGGAYRHTVVVRAATEKVRRVMKQLESAIGVLDAAWYPIDEAIDREMALYKLSVDLVAGGDALESVITRSRARIVLAGADYVIVEKTGGRDEINELFDSLERFGVMEFVRTGQATLTRPPSEAALDGHHQIHMESGTS
jgi:acetolactate synthase-1/3 small subunit